MWRASRPNGILTSFDFLNSRLSIAVVAPYMTALLLSVLKFLGFLESSVMLDLWIFQEVQTCAAPSWLSWSGLPYVNSSPGRVLVVCLDLPTSSLTIK